MVVLRKEYQSAITKTMENDSDNRVSDIHIWRVGANHYAAIISLVTHSPKPVQYYKKTYWLIFINYRIPLLKLMYAKGSHVFSAYREE